MSGSTRTAAAAVWSSASSVASTSSSATATTSKAAMQTVTRQMARASLHTVRSPHSTVRVLSSSQRFLVPSNPLQNTARSIHTSPSSSATPAPTPAQEAPAEAAVEAAASTTPAAKWTPSSRRVGLIAKKVGMTSYFMPSGQRVPATVFRVTSNQVSAQIGFSAPTTREDGTPIPAAKIRARLAYTAIQVAATDVLSNRGVPKPRMGHLAKAGIEVGKRIVKEFKVSRDAIVPLGTRLSAAHFVPGQYIDVRGKTRGKGFQGVMKRHGFGGLPASHGTSISHRSHGSTGQNQDPGRVFPGKKMAGRMGGRNSTVQNLEVLRIDTVRDLVVVKGAVPGPEGAHVILSDAKKALVGKAANAWNKGILLENKAQATGKEPSEAYLPGNVIDLPFPAGTREMADTLPEIIEVGPRPQSA